MASLNSIVRFLNKELNIKNIPDVSRNGLQVRSPKEIEVIGFAVDASLSTFKKAKANKVDLLVVHHGIYWKGQRDKMGTRKKRVEWLTTNKMNLYAVHIPLDLHPLYGNNARLVSLFDLKNIKPFGKFLKMKVGFKGTLKRPLALKTTASILDKKIGSNSTLLNFGKKKVKTIGIVSGGGASDLIDAHKEKLDCFITGEASHHVEHEVRDLKTNVILAGHYETETLGVRALMSLLRKHYDVKTVFIDVPTKI